jgi:hypothetical protein
MWGPHFKWAVSDEAETTQDISLRMDCSVFSAVFCEPTCQHPQSIVSL